MKELDAYRVIDAEFDSGVLMVVGRPGGKDRHRFDRPIFRFDEACEAYDLRTIEDVPYAGLNFVVLDSGVCVSVTEEDTIELFRSRPGSNDRTVIDDDVAGGDIELTKRGGQLLFKRYNQLRKRGIDFEV